MRWKKKKKQEKIEEKKIKQKKDTPHQKGKKIINFLNLRNVKRKWMEASSKWFQKILTLEKSL